MIFTVTSCNLENGIIQKRKYQKGYYISIAKNNKVVVPFNESSNKEQCKNKEREVKTNKEGNNQVDQSSKLVQLEKSSENISKEAESRSNNLDKEKPFKNQTKSVFKKLNNVSALSKEITNNTSVKPNNQSNDNLINLILIVALVVAIVMLLSFLDGLLGGILSAILLIVIIVLLLSYFGFV
jgi:magnesium-transporting ATPase (P-type)